MTKKISLHELREENKAEAATSAAATSDLQTVNYPEWFAQRIEKVQLRAQFLTIVAQAAQNEGGINSELSDALATLKAARSEYERVYVQNLFTDRDLRDSGSGEGLSSQEALRLLKPFAEVLAKENDKLVATLFGQPLISASNHALDLVVVAHLRVSNCTEEFIKSLRHIPSLEEFAAAYPSEFELDQLIKALMQLLPAFARDRSEAAFPDEMGACLARLDQLLADNH